MTPLESIKQKILQELSPPTPVRVSKSYIKKAGGGYCLDGEVLRPESLEGTGEILKDVPISPIWAGKNGQGIFCPPEKNQVIIVSFINFNRAFPYFDGIWSDTYKPAEGGEGQFVLTDGKGGIFRMSGDGLFSVMNSGKSLKVILEKIVDGFINLKTVGPPPRHNLDPAQAVQMAVLRSDIGLLFKE